MCNDHDFLLGRRWKPDVEKFMKDVFFSETPGVVNRRLLFCDVIAHANKTVPRPKKSITDLNRSNSFKSDSHRFKTEHIGPPAQQREFFVRMSATGCHLSPLRSILHDPILNAI